MLIHTYIIALQASKGEAIFSVRIDAASKKQAQDTGEEMAEALLPILSVHYECMGLGSLDKLKVMTWRE